MRDYKQMVEGCSGQHGCPRPITLSTRTLHLLCIVCVGHLTRLCLCLDSREAPATDGANESNYTQTTNDNVKARRENPK